jgi:hypothetical protein
MELQDGPSVVLGNYIMEQGPVNLPDWIETTVMPKAPEPMKPFLDIYAQTVRINDTLLRIEAAILELQKPWYRRLYEFFTKGA